MKKFYSIILIGLITFGFAQTYTANFESETKGGYASADLDIGSPTINWNLTDAVIGNLASDWFNGTKSLRMRGYATSVATMNANKTGGIGNISFFYKQYGTDSQNSYNVDWSSDGTTWTTIGTITANSTVQSFNYTLNQASARIRIKAAGGASSNQRMNIDDIVLTDSGTAGSPTLTANPSTVNFGNQIIATTSSVYSVTVAASSLTNPPTYALSGTNAGQFNVSGTLTTTGGSLAIAFTPTSTGTNSATLTIMAGGLSQTVSLTGKGVTAGNPFGLDDTAPLGVLSENFETGTVNTNVNPSGWINVAETGSDRKWDTKAFGGNQYAQMSAFNGTGTYKTLLISPAVNLDNINKTAVSFDWNSGFSNGATLDVYIVKLVSGVMQKTLLQTINDNVNTAAYGAAFTTVTLNLSAYSGVAFLAFEYNGVGPTATTTTYQIDNVNMPSSLAVIDIKDIKKQFVKNTIVNDEISFGSKTDVKLYNIYGQFIKSASVSENTNLEVADLKSGTYIVTGIVNGQTVSQKIMKK